MNIVSAILLPLSFSCGIDPPPATPGTVYEGPSAPADVLLNMSNAEGIELYALNNIVVSPGEDAFKRFYGAKAHAYAIQNDDAGNRIEFSDDLSVALGDDKSEALLADANLLYSNFIFDHFFDASPAFEEGDTTLFAGDPVFVRVTNDIELEIDLPVLVENADTPLNEPLSLALRTVAFGGVNGGRWVLKKDELIKVYELENVSQETTIEVSTDDLAELGPGLLEVWFVAEGRFSPAENLTMVNAFSTSKTIRLVEDAQ